MVRQILEPSCDLWVYERYDSQSTSRDDQQYPIHAGEDETMPTAVTSQALRVKVQ